MSNELRALVEREILTWPGVSMEAMAGGIAQGKFVVPPANVYNVGRRQLGHIHEGGIADLLFPRALCDELIASGRAEPHGADLPGVVTYHLRTPEDVPATIALFRLGYDRAQRSTARRSAGPTE